jgi:hypothetical protein
VVTVIPQLWYCMGNMTENIQTQTPSPEHQENIDLFRDIDAMQKQREAEIAASQRAAAEFQAKVDTASEPLEAARVPTNFIKQAAKASAGLGVATALSYGGASLTADAIDSQVEYQEKTGREVQEMVEQSDREIAFEQGMEKGSVSIDISEEAPEQLPSPEFNNVEPDKDPPTLPSPEQKN